MSEWTISPQGIGGFVLGSPRTAIDAPLSNSSGIPAAGECSTMFFWNDQRTTHVVVTDDGSGLVGSVHLTAWGASESDVPRTTGGIGIGTTRADLVAAFPDGVWAQGDMFEFSGLLTYAVTLDDVPAAFGLLDDVVTQVVVGNDVFQYEYCG